MKPDYWVQRWEAGQIAFNQERAHAALPRWWASLGVSGGTVLVPLCGKSVDLRWLAERGHRVVGVEVSPVAVAAFFEEHGWTPTWRDEPGFRVAAANGVEIWQGDWWAFRPPAVDAVYDRASIIALPPEDRARHAAKLRSLSAPILLVTLEHAGGGGPPFSVPKDEVESYFPGAERLERTPMADEPGKAPSRVEEVWRIPR